MPLSQEHAKFLRRLGSSLKAERECAQMTQQRLAELADLDIRTVQKIEAGKLNILITTLGRLRAALKCEWDDLLVQDGRK